MQIEENYTNLQKRNLYRNKEKACILKEIEVNGKLLFLQITSTSLKLTCDI